VVLGERWEREARRAGDLFLKEWQEGERRGPTGQGSGPRGGSWESRGGHWAAAAAAAGGRARGKGKRESKGKGMGGAEAGGAGIVSGSTGAGEEEEVEQPGSRVRLGAGAGTSRGHRQGSQGRQQAAGGEAGAPAAAGLRGRQEPSACGQLSPRKDPGVQAGRL